MIDSTTGWALQPEAKALVRTDDGGRQWTQLLPGVTSYFALNAEVAWASDSDGTGIYFSVTRDAGFHWQRSGPLSIGKGAHVLTMDFADPTHGWAVMITPTATSAGISLYRTVDSAMHWTLLKPSGEDSCAAEAVSFLNAATGWRISSCGLSASQDGGVTWQKVALSPAPPNGALSVFTLPAFFDQKNGYLVRQVTSTSVIGDQGSTSVYFTNDGGKTWTGRVTPTAASLPDSSFSDPLHGWYLAKQDYTLMGTTDGGNHWAPVSRDPALQNVVSLQFASPTVGFAQLAGQEPGLLKTVDGGKTWQNVQVAVGIP
jgi:photosystem II stability/assembly factor-like uncharacterized protein